ncbi:MAG: hypothetical protein NZ484_02155, partial [Patescibacteria group bacterium]|nr:hypothetical protein [Patescibacteria group bacterium]
LQEGGLKYMPRDRFAPIQTPQDIVYLIGEILVLLATIFWILAVIASFYAGYLFLFSGGSEEKVGKAKKMFLYAVIAIVIGLMAYALPTLIYNLLDVGSGIWFRIRLRF